jgi:pilus assembly protein FimV
VKKGDTLGAIARANLPAGVSLNQMLIAIYRANQDAFIRENVNLVRAGRILNIPTPRKSARSMPPKRTSWCARTWRSSASTAAASPPCRRRPTRSWTARSTGTIQPKPEAPKPAPDRPGASVEGGSAEARRHGRGAR